MNRRNARVGESVGNTLAQVNVRAGPINTNHGKFVVGGLDDDPKVGNSWLKG